jgi:hypothetical protein
MLGRIPIMLDEKQILPLQSSDMLAWIERRTILKDSRQREEWDWLYERLNPLVRSRMRYYPEDLKFMVYLKEHPFPNLPEEL